jgi:small subunit ribosomal protein S5
MAVSAWARASQKCPWPQKAMEEARRKLIKVTLKNGTVQHTVIGKHGASCDDLAGQGRYWRHRRWSDARDLRSDGRDRRGGQVDGSTNPYNMVRATLDGLSKMNTPAEIAAKRGKSVEEILG